MPKPLIVTLGDPFSCNVELIARSFECTPILSERPVVLVGSLWHWQDQLMRLGEFTRNATQLDDMAAVMELSKAGLYFFDIGQNLAQKPAETLTLEERGKISLAPLSVYREWVSSSQRPFPDVLTAPIDKNAMHHVGFVSVGHTEFFAEVFDCNTVMILAGPSLKVALVTNHLKLSEVSQNITEQAIIDKAALLCDSAHTHLGMKDPRIAITAMNPHAGDSGLLGREEIEIIGPAVHRLNSDHSLRARFSGPKSADSVFFEALTGKFDLVLAMYHDQALGPLKTVHFDTAINITGGLPIKRVSPDHGPASDLFLKGEASVSSFQQAFRFMCDGECNDG